MSEQKPEVDLDELMTRIRMEVGRRRRTNGAGPSRTTPGDASRLAQLEGYLEVTGQYTHLAACAPDSARYAALVRPLARWSGSIVGFLASFITERQSRFNTSVLHVVKLLIREMEAREGRVAEREARLEQEIARLRDDLAAQERRIAELSEALDRP